MWEAVFVLATMAGVLGLVGCGVVVAIRWIGRALPGSRNRELEERVAELERRLGAGPPRDRFPGP